MNKIYIKAFATLLIFGAVAGCKGEIDQDAITLPKVVERPMANKSAIRLSVDKLMAKLGQEKAVLEITAGSGDYTAMVLDPSIASVEVKGNKIEVTGLLTGKSKLLVMDKDGNATTLPLGIYEQDAITLAKESAELTTLLGWPETVYVGITQGNGQYHASCDDPSVKVAITDDNQVVINASARQEPYTAKVVVEDKSGLTKEFSLSVKTKEEFYTAEKIEEIKSQSSVRYNIERVRNLTFGSIARKTGDEFSLGANAFSNKIAFTYTGDQSLGVKQGKLVRFVISNKEISTDRDLKIEIIKNDGAKVWGLISWVEAGRLYYGHYCERVLQ